jgi:hypothetical protein
LRRLFDEMHGLLPLASDSDADLRLLLDRWLARARRLVDLADVGSGPPLPVLEALGRERGIVRLGHRKLRLSTRHTEILVLLASHPRGMTTEEIAASLYGDAGRPASVRTALCRMRKSFAPWISAERSRVTLKFDADFLVIQRLLRTGRTREAATLYSAALLPHSEAPGVVEAREELDAWVRSAAITCGDREALWSWLNSDSGEEDLLAWKRLLAELDFADPRRPLAVGRLTQLRNALTRAA